MNGDLREIRTAKLESLSYSGRAKDLIDKPEEARCPCQEVIIRPSGDAHLCGCEDAPRIGDVWDGWEPEQNEHGDWPCYQEERGAAASSVSS